MTTSMWKFRSKLGSGVAALAWSMWLSKECSGSQRNAGGGRWEGNSGGGGTLGVCRGTLQRAAECQRRAARVEPASGQSGFEQPRRIARSENPRAGHRQRSDGGVARRKLVVVAPSQRLLRMGPPGVLAVRLLLHL